MIAAQSTAAEALPLYQQYVTSLNADVLKQNSSAKPHTIPDTTDEFAWLWNRIRNYAPWLDRLNRGYEIIVAGERQKYAEILDK